MKKIITTLTVLLLAAAPAAVRAQSSGSSEPLPAGAAGTEYYVAFMQNEDNRLSAFRAMTLNITSEVSTTGYVEIPGSGVQPFTTLPGQVTTVSVPNTLELRISEETSRGAIHVVARAPVTVFVVNARNQSDGVYAALPLNLWGRRYLTMNLPNADGERTGEFVIVAAYDSTLVTIRPTANTYRADAGREISLYLNRGETFLVQAAPGAGGDLSGSEVAATRPVGLVSGHMRSPVLTTGTVKVTSYSMQMAAMLLPDSLWGKEYFTIPCRATGDLFRLLPSADGTRIIITHYAATGVDRDTIIRAYGQVSDISTVKGKPITGPVYWQASRPTLLVQFRTGGEFGNPNDAPAMLPVTALEHAASRSVFVAPAQFGGDYFTGHTLTVIVKGNPAVSATDPANPLLSVMLDKNPLATLAPALTGQRIGNTEYYYATLPVGSGGHVIWAKPTVTVSGYITGNNGDVARDNYMWPLPFWTQQVGPDLTPPYMAGVVSGTPYGSVTVKISDRTPAYFSGVADVKVSAGNWKISAFTAPNPDDDALVTFTGTADPTGPLMAQLTDRDGNQTVVKLHDGLCFKTATFAKSAIQMNTPQNVQAVFQAPLLANPCGDQATVQSLWLDAGPAKDYLTLSNSVSASVPFPIPAYGSALLTLTSHTGTPQGTYTCNLNIRIDADSVIVVPVTLSVGPPSGVQDQFAGTSALLTLNVTPNPVADGQAAAISLALPVAQHVRITVSSADGQVLATPADGLLQAGLHRLQWNTRGMCDGIYFCRVQTAAGSLVRKIVVIR